MPRFRTLVVFTRLWFSLVISVSSGPGLVPSALGARGARELQGAWHREHALRVAWGSHSTHGIRRLYLETPLKQRDVLTGWRERRERRLPGSCALRPLGVPGQWPLLLCLWGLFRT